ncbi:inositol phosphate phosphatase SopB [Parendozoicomonas sp. Alg238-R29]|uniref:inositol phosphate phosphatase SopB n=1 Tax=Parendozoicomonas sp. Alg238-R29 TaxID=2993446 RepID=UPI00248DC5DA|nr:inositol phosphate phosphatase SopB [Parendozoicomonas sp. Alg238-R29]
MQQDEILPTSADIVVRRHQRDMFMPIQSSGSNRVVSTYEPELEHLLEGQGESRSLESPAPEEDDEVVFATVGSSRSDPIPIKKPLEPSVSLPVFSSSYEKGRMSPGDSPETSLPGQLKKSWTKRFTRLKSRLVSSKTSLSEEQSAITTKLKSHLHLRYKSEVLNYIEGLNDDNDDSAFETASASSSEASTPVGSTEDSHMPSSLAFSELQENLSRSSRHTAIFDFSNKASPICLAIENQWGVAAQNLSAWEQERIQAHCSFYLNSSSVLPNNDNDVSLMLQSYLLIYVPAFNELLPKTCEALKLKSPVWKSDVVKVLQNDESPICDSESADEVIQDVIEYIQQAEEALMGALIDSTTVNSRDYSSRIASYRQSIENANDFCQRLEKEKKNENLPDYLVSALQKDMEDVKARFLQAEKVTRQFEQSDFRSKKNWDYCIDIMRQAAFQYIKKNLKDEKQNAACRKLSSWAGEQMYPETGIASFITELDAREKILLDTLGISKKVFDSLRFQALADQPPQVRTKELHYLFEGQYHMVKVSHTPPACLTFGKDVEGNKDPLELNGRFIPSCQRDASRAVNMSVTRVSMEGEDIMKEVRVGVPFAFAVSDNDLQKDITLKRFKDILTVCGMTFFEEQMLQCFHVTGTQPRRSMRLPVLNVNLLSPDNLRPAFSSISGVDNEKLWCHKIEKRIDELNDKPFVLSVRRKDGMTGSVTVFPDIVLVVCPCNQLAYASSMQFTKTWENADKYNQKAFMHLFGTVDPDAPMTDESYVQTFLREHPDLDPLIRKELQELCHLILYIFSNKIHHKLGDQPFIFTTCISELGRAMNMAIVSGCKSAKDRTGNYERSNIETALRLHFIRKEMAARIKEYGERYKIEYAEAVSRSVEQIIPPIDRRMTAEDFYNNVMTLLCTGQVEVTMECLGKPGFKLPDYMLGFIKEVYPTVNGYLTADKKTSVAPSPKSRDSAAGGTKAL